MIRIYKYTLRAIPENQFEMPAGAQILDVQNQNGELCLWAEIDTDNEPEIRTFRTFMTGKDQVRDEQAEYKYIGTQQFHSGSLVLHVYEVLR